MDKHSQENAWDTDTGDFPSMLILLTLETTQMTKTTVNLLPFYLCCTLQGEVSALYLPGASLHFQPKYVKLHKEGEVKITALHNKRQLIYCPL